jgi:hypothetical protein
LHNSNWQASARSLVFQSVTAIASAVVVKCRRGTKQTSQRGFYTSGSLLLSLAQESVEIHQTEEESPKLWTFADYLERET